MQTLLNPKPTTPWEVVPIPHTLLAPLAAWATADDKRQATAYLCLLPFGRLASLEFHTAFHNNPTEVRLFPQGMDQAQATETALLHFRAWAEINGRENIHPIPVDSDDAIRRWHSSATWFARAWDDWARATKELSAISAVDLKQASVLAALLLQAELPATPSPGALALEQAFLDGHIPVEAPETIPTLAAMLGLLCDQQQEGPRDAERLFRKECGSRYQSLSAKRLGPMLTAYRDAHEGRVLGTVLGRMFQATPQDELLARQALLDKFFQSNPNEDDIRNRCRMAQPLQGPMPVRLSVVQMLCELISAKTLEGFLNWASAEASVPA